jgi:hypothetical protein
MTGGRRKEEGGSLLLITEAKSVLLLGKISTHH